MRRRVVLAVLGTLGAIAACATVAPQDEATSVAPSRARPQSDAAVPCRTRADCGCTGRYKPAPARGGSDSGAYPMKPGDCIVTCNEGLCATAQGPM